MRELVRYVDAVRGSPLLKAVALLLILAGVYNVFVFGFTLFSSPEEYGIVGFSVEIKSTDSGYDVNIYPRLVEVGTSKRRVDVGVVYSSWPSCSSGVYITLLIDGSEYFGPYCPGFIGSIGSLISGKYTSYVSVRLLKGNHTVTFYVKDSERPDVFVVKSVSVVVPSVDEVKRCNGVWPCAGYAGGVEENAGS